MAANDALSSIFGEMAAILEITGANPFRVNAYARLARVLKDLTVDVAQLTDDPNRLTAIEGIGEGSARKIIEYVKTGRIEGHERLLDEIPRGLLEVVKIPGLGPKTVRLMWEQAGVTDLVTLKQKMDAGQIEKLPRLGPKAVENIRAAMAFMGTAGERRRLGQTLLLAEAIVERLRRVSGTNRAECAGSLRRGRETIGDIDILAVTTDPGALGAAFREMPGVVQVLAAGETKSSVRLRDGMQVDLRVVDDASFGAALMYFTGSKEHNVALRERAIKREMRLNEYGLASTADDACVAAADEADIYAALELPYIPPELREDRGELALTETPRLIEIQDIRAELHAHTVASDGRMTIEQLAAAAKARGLHTIAVTDHSKSSIGGGLSVQEMRAHIVAVREADERVDGITILIGSEVDILADGRLDYDDDLLAELDVVVASPHSSLRQDPATSTKRLLAAVTHPLVHVLGHPTGRMINRRDGLEPDINALAAAAAEHGTALEVNANSLRLDLRDAHVRAAVDAGALVAINCDVHRIEDFDELRYGVLTARRGWLEPGRCPNTWPVRKLHDWLKKKR